MYHYHFSAKQVRVLAGVEETDGVYLCPICGEKGLPGKTHTANNSGRIKICLSSSTLHEFWIEGWYGGDKTHIDWLTSPGATIQSLEYMFRLDYHHEKKGMDVLLVAGLNNVKNESVDTIMERIRAFGDTVITQAEEYHPEQPSTFHVATLPYPSQFCWFPADGPLPYQNYDNKLAMMEELNWKIAAYNQEMFDRQIKLYERLGGGKTYKVCLAPKFHTYGIRTSSFTNKRGKNVTVSTHRWEWWRSTEPRSRMLHLDDLRRNSMGSAVNNYFLHQFGKEKSI